MGKVRAQMVDPGGNSSATQNKPAKLREFRRAWCTIAPAMRAAWRLAFAVMLLAGSVAAQETKQSGLAGLSIEELAKIKVDSVYGASKFLQKVSDAPTSVTVVTAEEIQEHGYRTLAEVLKSIRGFYVINDRNYSYVGVRGFSRPGDVNARILFLVDGHRINENIFDGTYVGTGFPIDVDLIERIEVTRGPSSSVYGAGAFVAVVNVITKRGRDLGATEVSTEAGSWESYGGRITYGGRLDNGFETLLSGSFYNSEGHERLFYPEFNSPATNNGIAENADGDQAYSTFASFLYKDFDIHLVQNSRTKHIPTASFGTVFNDPNTKLRTRAHTSTFSIITVSVPGRRWDVPPLTGTAMKGFISRTLQAQANHPTRRTTMKPTERGLTSKGMLREFSSSGTRSRLARNSARISR